MEAVKETRYKNGILQACSVDGSCPLEATCMFWDAAEKRCGWPETAEKGAET